MSVLAPVHVDFVAGGASDERQRLFGCTNRPAIERIETRRPRPKVQLPLMKMANSSIDLSRLGSIVGIDQIDQARTAQRLANPVKSAGDGDVGVDDPTIAAYEHLEFPSQVGCLVPRSPHFILQLPCIDALWLWIGVCQPASFEDGEAYRIGSGCRDDLDAPQELQLL